MQSGAVFIPHYTGTGALGRNNISVFDLDNIPLHRRSFFPSSGLALSLLTIFGVVIFFVLIFEWADSNIRVGRRSDPLLRNTFHWSIVGKIFWTILLSLLAITFIANFVSALEPQNNLASNLSGLSYFLFVLLPFCTAVPALFLSAKRSGDKTFRKSAEWFGFALLFLVLAVGVVSLIWGNSNIPLNSFSVLLLLPLTGMSYSLYKCSRSLVPLNRISLDIPKT
jgi:uncharacterized membrane protein YhaH (DUF805 family)